METIYERVVARALKILKSHPEGMRFAELKRRVAASDRSFKLNTIGCGSRAARPGWAALPGLRCGPRVRGAGAGAAGPGAGGIAAGGMTVYRAEDADIPFPRRAGRLQGNSRRQSRGAVTGPPCPPSPRASQYPYSMESPCPSGLTASHPDPAAIGSSR